MGFIVAFLLGSCVLNDLVSAQQPLCTLCVEEGAEIDPIYKSKPVGIIAPIPIATCSNLASILAFLPNDNPLCQQARLLGPYCGCPVANDRCRICSDVNATMSNATLPLGDLLNIPPVSGLDPTCELVDSGMKLMNENDAQCLGMPLQNLEDLCGCESSVVQQPDPNTEGGQASCPLCMDGEILTSMRISYIHFQGAETPISCFQLAQMADDTPSESPLCRAIHEHSFLCGCLNDRSDSCRLCEKKQANSGSLIKDLSGSETFCSNYEAKIRTFPATDPDCYVTDEMIETCGCVDELPNDRCTLCPGGDPVGFPDKDLTGQLAFLDEFMRLQLVPRYSCGFLQAGVAGEAKDSAVCLASHALARACGCEVREGSCHICGVGNDMTKPLARSLVVFGDAGDRVTYSPVDEEGTSWSDAVTDQSLSCEIVDSAMNEWFDDGDKLCYIFVLQKSHFCGCENPNQKGVFLILCQRVMGTLSMLGSMLIIAFILRGDKRKRWTTYNQLVLGASVFDIFSSLALALGALPVPKEMGIYGAGGNDHTCRFQGFMFQLGLTSIFYNVLLSTYYLLVIKHGWTERKFKKIAKWAHASVIVVGLIMASASIPFHFGSWRWCYILRPPFRESYVPSVMFFVLPVSLAIVAITVATSMMVWYVRTQERKTMKMSMTKSVAKLTKKTFWQSLWYLMVFYLVWPISFATYLMWITPSNYWFYVVAAILGPSQGIGNALVFFNKKRATLKKMYAGSALSTRFFTMENMKSARFASSRFWPKKNKQNSGSGSIAEPAGSSRFRFETPRRKSRCRSSGDIEQSENMLVQDQTANQEEEKEPEDEVSFGEGDGICVAKNPMSIEDLPAAAKSKTATMNENKSDKKASGDVFTSAVSKVDDDGAHESNTHQRESEIFDDSSPENTPTKSSCNLETESVESSESAANANRRANFTERRASSLRDLRASAGDFIDRRVNFTDQRASSLREQKTSMRDSVAKRASLIGARASSLREPKATIGVDTDKRADFANPKGLSPNGQGSSRSSRRKSTIEPSASDTGRSLGKESAAMQKRVSVALFGMDEADFEGLGLSDDDEET